MKAVLCPVLLLVAGGGGGGGAEAGLLGAGTGEGSCAAPPFRNVPVYCNSVHTRMQLCMYTVKKRLAVFPSPAGMSLTKHPGWRWDGKIASLFFTVY
jgi:hypothetical protein